MLLNLSHHPADGWGDAQQEAARVQFESFEDLAFPAVDTAWSAAQVATLAEEYAARCLKKLEASREEENAVHVMGEMTFTFALVAGLQQAGVRCIASTTERRSVEQPDGSRNVTFRFVQFRDYPHIGPALP